MKILVTGTAGFIGSFLSVALAAKGNEVYGIDSINDYYAPSLKLARLEKCGIQTDDFSCPVRSSRYPTYTFEKINLCHKERLDQIFNDYHFDCVINLAAQAGVRYSLTNPEAYIQSNINGFLNILESCRKHNCTRLIYASSSSVYGNTDDTPFQESARVDHPVSIYAATKKSNELMAYTYSHLYGIQTIGLRFFTVYGPYGRPDMAPALFADAILHNQTIRIFNHGDMARDFTYIDDIISGIVKITDHPELARQENGVPASIYNIGHGSPVSLMDFVHTLEKYMGKEALKEYVGMQPGDVYQTWADTSHLQADYDYTPSTSFEEGIRKFAEWYKAFYQK